MAAVDNLQNFIEARLTAWMPSIDLSSNSSAQLQIVQPLLALFADDPLDTDIATFLKDRLLQEFPDLVADSGGDLTDILINPLQLMLEPFKRAVNTVKINQSVKNASIMSDDDADSLGANWFEDRNEGNSTGGGVRIYFSAPTASRITTDKRCFTASGLSFFPVQNYSITAPQMLFNRQGSFYFLDIVVRAESPGDGYNVAIGAISGIENVPGVIKVSNLSAFNGGLPREANEEYLGRIPETLTERSLTTSRGVTTRTPQVFDSVRAMQVVGAGDNGMNRDILTGTGEGFLHLVGQGTVYGDWLLTTNIIYRDAGPTNSLIPQAGDTIKVHNDTLSPTTVHEAVVLSVLAASGDAFIFLLDRTIYAPGTTTTGRFALLKAGYITISGVPGGISADIVVPSDTVHLGGHTDVFIRPTGDVELQSTLQSVTDQSPVVAVVDLVVTTAGSNRVGTALVDFVAAGVEFGDVLVIETGVGFAGSYNILEVEDATHLRVDSIFSVATGAGVLLRARIVRNITIDLVAPKIPKLPFNTGSVSDLRTTVGSNEFRFDTVNVLNFGAKAGDTIKVLDGPDSGEFTIISFGVVGTLFVDRIAGASGANLHYELYTKLTGLTLPLVRVENLSVLDSTNQATGITVPYGDAVYVEPTSDLVGAGSGLVTYDQQLVIFPDMVSIWGPAGGNPTLADNPISGGSISSTTDARYTQELLPRDVDPNSVVRQVTSLAGNTILTSEINLPPFLWNGRNDKLLALTTKKDTAFQGTGNNQTSDLADAKAGDSLYIHDGPNQGNYIIRDIRVLDLWGKLDIGHKKVAVLQIDPPLKVDPIRTCINLINAVNAGPFWTDVQLVGFFDTAPEWDDSSSFYTAFLTQLRVALATLGVTFSSLADLKTFFDSLCRTSYTVGPSAKGLFRLFFTDPVSIELSFGDSPTTFESAITGDKKYRLDPTLPPAQILPESEQGTPPTQWNRDLSMRNPQDTYAFDTSGTPLAALGIRVDDTLEFYPAINDLPARDIMTSSWLGLTQTGSNIVQLLLPPNAELDNYTALDGGQLMFIDSGADVGAYTIVKIIAQNWAASPIPLLQVQIDQAMTHTTDEAPLLTGTQNEPPQIDFGSGLPAYVKTSTLTFPMNIHNKKVKFSRSTNSGGSYTTYEHTFSTADPYNNIAAVVADLQADGSFTALFKAVAIGTDKLAIVSLVAGPAVRVRVETPSSASAYGNLPFTIGDVEKGIRGGSTLSSTNRIYGSSLNQAQIGDWITIYAASDTSILNSGDDAPLIGSFAITATGTADDAGAPFWTGFNNYVELNRTAVFPAENTPVRWVRHASPSTTPQATNGGGTTITDQFVRIRLYDSSAKKIEVASIPWSDSPHPLLASSDKQIVLDSPIVDTGAGGVNFSHMSPYRFLRDGIMRVSSTAMAKARDGALYFVDVPIVGYGPGPEMNALSIEGFVITEGTAKIAGYLLEVEDENFVYSSQELVSIVIPGSILPVGSAPGLQNEFSLAGQNIQVTYNNADLIQQIQNFYNSPLDRVVVANLLARHFFPAYVFVDAIYSGGDATNLVAQDIISYLNNVSPSVAEIRADVIESLISARGATKVVLPITLVALVHGSDRRIRGMKSETSIGVNDLPLFKGNFQQTYFIAGPDTSSDSVRPDGEQVFLRRT